MNPFPSIQTATPADDAALRHLLRATPLPGKIRVSLEREPSWSEGQLDCLHHDTAINYQGGQPAACGSRILRRAWWQGQAADTAYLADLRVHPDYQNRAGRLLQQGFRHLEARAAARPAAVTWTAIFEENHHAREILTSGRAGLPTYTDRGRLICPAFPVRPRMPAPDTPGLTWDTGTFDDLPAIAAFLTARQKHRPLAPVHRAEDFAAGTRWPGLSPGHFLLARRDGRLAGVIAVWDQRAFRQVHIQKVSGSLRFARWIYRPIARVFGWTGVPPDHSILSLAHASFLAVEDDEPALARQLILAAQAAASRRRIQWLCLCLHESDPLAAALKGMPFLSSHGRLYQVSRTPESWLGTAPVIESATL